MKKGDLRKREILNAAEALFCQKGYEQTSIQDILDVLNTSKGSFYHHFVSKEALLEGICQKRAEQIYQTALSSVNEQLSAADNLNQLLSGMIPFRDEKLVFLLMLLPIFSLPEGRIVKICYCDALARLFTPAVSEWLRRGHESGELYCTDPDIAAGLILSLVNRLWVQVCEMIIQAEGNGTEPDLSAILRLTETYRLSIGQIVSLPYGYVKMIDLPSLRLLCEQIHNHWSCKKTYNKEKNRRTNP